MRTRLAVALGMVAALAPRVALACPTCVSSAYGDRTFNWAYLGLLLMPFALCATVGALLAWRAGYRIDLAAIRRLWHRSPPIVKETS